MAQQKSGKVSDKTSGSPLEKVSVYIPDLNRISFSDNKGVFTFSDLPDRSLVMEFSMVGYKTVVVNVDTKQGMLPDIEMERSVKEINDVTISAAKTRITNNTPYSVIAVTQDELRSAAAPSTMMNLSYQPGVDRISIGNGINKPVIRGLSFNQIALFSQGTRIENQQWDDHHDLGLTDIGIRSVEIVRGPAALMYGADAIGGAMIFNDELPAAAGTINGVVNTAFFTNTLGLNLDAGITGAGSKGFFYGLYAGGTSHTSYVQGEGEDDSGKEEEEFAANSKMMNASIKAYAGLSKKWGMSKLTYSMFNQQIGIIELENDASKAGEEEEQRDREMEAPYQDVTTHILSLENTIYAGRSKWNINAGYQLNQRKEYEPLINKEKELAIGLDLNTITYDVKWSSNEEKNFGITIGSQGVFLKNENNGKEALVPDADVSDIAGYGLLRYDIGKFNFLGGIRYDLRSIEAESYEENEMEEGEDTLIMLHHHDTLAKPEFEYEKEFAPVSFSLGAAYHLTDDLILKLNVATGFTAPNYAQLATFGKHEGTYRFEKGKSNLDVEQNLEGDFGMEWNGSTWTFGLSGYYNAIGNYIYIAATGDSIIRIRPSSRDTLPVYNYRQGDAVISGAEMSASYHPLNHKWIELNGSVALISGTLNSGGALPYIPSNKVIGSVKFKKEKIWKLKDAYFTVVFSNYSERSEVASYELSSDSYSLVDLHAGAVIPGTHRIAFSLFCTNLLNTGYYNQLSLVKYIGVKDMGRNFGFRLNIPFSIKG